MIDIKSVVKNRIEDEKRFYRSPLLALATVHVSFTLATIPILHSFSRFIFPIISTEEAFTIVLSILLPSLFFLAFISSYLMTDALEHRTAMRWYQSKLQDILQEEGDLELDHYGHFKMEGKRRER